MKQDPLSAKVREDFEDWCKVQKKVEEVKQSVCGFGIQSFGGGVSGFWCVVYGVGSRV